METMPEVNSACNRSQCNKLIDRTVTYFEKSVEARIAAHEFEKGLWDRLREFGASLLRSYFAEFGNLEEGEVAICTLDGKGLPIRGQGQSAPRVIEALTTKGGAKGQRRCLWLPVVIPRIDIPAAQKTL